MNATFSRARAGQPRVVCEPSVFEKLLPPLAFRVRRFERASQRPPPPPAARKRRHSRARTMSVTVGDVELNPRDVAAISRGVGPESLTLTIRAFPFGRVRPIERARSSALLLSSSPPIRGSIVRRDPAAAPSLPRERIESASARRPTSRPSSRARSHLPPPPPPPRARRDGSARSASVAAARAIATSSSASNQSASSSSSATA